VDCRFKSFGLATKICQQADNPALGVFACKNARFERFDR